MPEEIKLTAAELQRLISALKTCDVKPGSPVFCNVTLRKARLPENGRVITDIEYLSDPVPKLEVPMNVDLRAIKNGEITVEEPIRVKYDAGPKVCKFDYSDESSVKPAPIIAAAIGSLAVVAFICFAGYKIIKRFDEK